MVASDGFRELLVELLSPLGRISTRRMFGKTGVFCDGLMFGLVSDDVLYLRVDDLNRTAFAEATAYPPLNDEKQGKVINLAFWRAPERLLDKPDELLELCREALGTAARVASKRSSSSLHRKQGTPSDFPDGVPVVVSVVEAGGLEPPTSTVRL